MIPNNAPNEACRQAATRLYYFTVFLIVFGLIKYTVMPQSAFNDLLMAAILMCAIHSTSFVILAIYVFLFLTRLAEHVIFFLTIIQNDKPLIAGEASKDYARLIIIVTSFIHLFGNPP